MKRGQTGWLLPTSLTGYVALAALGYHTGLARWAVLLIAVVVALTARRFSDVDRAPFSPETLPGVHLVILGSGLFSAALFGPADIVTFQLASVAGQGCITAGALYAIAHAPGPDALFQGHRAARSLDALYISVVLWTVAAVVIVSRVAFPDAIQVDPPTLDTALLFGSLGSLLLLTVTLMRSRILRRLELGVGERAGAALSLGIAGTAVGAGSGLIQTTAADQVASITLAITGGSVAWAMAHQIPSQVTRFVRGALALLILGAPTALAGAWLALRLPEHPASVALPLATASMIVGLIAHLVSRPLAPEGSRWLDAVRRAMDGALHPEPDIALRRSLEALRNAERTAKNRPELFQVAPPAILSADIAGYVSRREADFPDGVYALACNEPGKTLRRETVLAAQVRRADVRPVAAWFEAHAASSATALFDDEGPVGLLALPRGKRRSPLALEEVELLEVFSERLAGLLSVTSALTRARQRELSERETAVHASEEAEELRRRLLDYSASGRRQAEMLEEPLLATGHGSAVLDARLKLEHHTLSPVVYLDTPPGGDAVSWAAHLHLQRDGDSPFVVLDCSTAAARELGSWADETAASPIARAAGGTLVLVRAGALPSQLRRALAERLRGHLSLHLVVCSHDAIRLEDLEGPAITLPSLADRADDLSGIINYELSRLSTSTAPIGIARPALAALLERPFPGNDAELRGILVAACTSCDEGLITLDDLGAVFSLGETAAPPQVKPLATPARTRTRPPPRGRR